MADFTKRSQEQIFELIKTQAAANFPEENFDLDENSLTGVLAKLVAIIYDQNAFYMDRRSEAAYLSRATLEQDVRSIVGNLGYRPAFKKGALVDVQLVATADVTIPKGSEVRNDDNVIFSTLSELALNAGNSYTGTVQCVHGGFSQKTYLGKGDSREEVSLRRDDVLEAQISITRNGGSFTDYDFEFDQLDNAVIVLNGLNLNDIVVIDYYSGGGVAGNKVKGGSSSEAGVLNELISTFTGSDNISDVSNALAPTGGAETPTVAEIIEQVPKFVESATAIITQDTPSGPLQKDSETAFIQDAFVVNGFDDGAGGTGKPQSKLIALPLGSEVTALSQSQQSALENFLRLKGHIGTEWSVESAVDAPVEVEMDVYLSNLSQSALKEAEILDYLLDDVDGVFRGTSLRFNREFKVDDFNNIKDDISGINRIDVKKLTKKPQFFQFSGTTNTMQRVHSHMAQRENAVYRFQDDGAGDIDIDYYIPFTPTVIGFSTLATDRDNLTVNLEKYPDTSGFSVTNNEGPWLVNDATVLKYYPGNNVFHDIEDIEPGHILVASFDDSANGYQRSYFLAHTIQSALNHVELKFLYAENQTLSPFDLANPGDTIVNANHTNIELRLVRNISVKDGVYAPNTELVYNLKTGASVDGLRQDENTITADYSGVGEKFAPGTRYLLKQRRENHVISAGSHYKSLNGGLTVYPSASLGGSDIVDVYVTPYLGDVSFKHPKEILSLSSSNIKINFR